MKKGLLIFCLMLSFYGWTQQVNYEKDKIPHYTLPDPLINANGKAVSNKNMWQTAQRSYILQLFKEHVYGSMPAGLTDMHWKVVEEDNHALNGKAKRKQVQLFLGKGNTVPVMQLLMYLPKSTNPVPVFVMPNFRGNQTITYDASVLPGKHVLQPHAGGNHNRSEAEVLASTIGLSANRWSINAIIDSGLGLVTVHYFDLEPDSATGWKDGIRYHLKDKLQIQPEEWGAIGAWAWGLSRIQDYLEKDAEVDDENTILAGHSRLGKAALWAGANDPRFSIVISNNSGEGGAAISRRMYGENIEHLNKNFPHWFVQAYKKYSNNVNELPVDQHMLLSLIAPRPLYVTSADQDQWADPEGEFLSAKHAEPVYKLFGLKGLLVNEMPPLNQPVGASIGYHIRSGIHDVNAYDWEQFIRFAKKHLKKNNKNNNNE